jgi:hypothetical protein
MALRKHLILRCLAQRGLEGRTALIQPSSEFLSSLGPRMMGFALRLGKKSVARPSARHPRGRPGSRLPRHQRMKVCTTSPLLENLEKRRCGSRPEPVLGPRNARTRGPGRRQKTQCFDPRTWPPRCSTPPTRSLGGTRPDQYFSRNAEFFAIGPYSAPSMSVCEKSLPR